VLLQDPVFIGQKLSGKTTLSDVGTTHGILRVHDAIQMSPFFPWGNLEPGERGGIRKSPGPAQSLTLHLHG
jgi:hypothetical protein